MDIINLSINIVTTIVAIAFVIWFIARTPDHLRKWYGVPVAIAIFIGLVLLWTNTLI